MDIGEYIERFQESGDQDDNHTITMTKLIITNNILRDVVNDMTERYLAIRAVLTMGQVLPDDQESNKFLLRVAARMTTIPIDNPFLAKWLEQEEDEDE